MPFRVLAATALAVALSARGATVDPNPIYAASDYRKFVRSVPNGKLYSVTVPGTNELLEMHLYGDAKARGVAQGQLIPDIVETFMFDELTEFFRSEVDQIPLGRLPQWLQSAIVKAGESLAPEAFDLALGYVYDREKTHTEACPSKIFDEVDGLIEGLCSTNRTSGICSDMDKLKLRARRINMLPELIRMQCSMMGAWGASTADGKLVQMRTLDFGTGPFANRSVIAVHHPGGDAQAFASITFPGFVGVVTGFSESIAQCEKVDDITGAKNPKGSYEGLADAFVIRQQIEFAKSKEDAVKIAQDAKRTWGVWLGYGDFASQEFVAMDYQQAHALPYDDQSLPSRTNQTLYKDVAYIDKHPQPSNQTDHPELPSVIDQNYGNITAQLVAQTFPNVTESGDVHIAIWDMGARDVYVAFGVTTANASSFVRTAYRSPFVKFSMDSLWAEKAPQN